LSPPDFITATIKARKQANGAIRYTAVVRKRVDKTIVHREAKTFTHRSAALSWASTTKWSSKTRACLAASKAGL